MKTLGATVGLLLLLAVYCCTAMPQGPNDLKPGRCCFKFFPGRIPDTHILSIGKTHESCSKRGFVINTPQGDYCVNLNQKWAFRAFLKTSTGSKRQMEQAASSILPPA
ncbi:C-C motif chemokine 4-like [Girardinichthys multiradiatus]|uniref:C-C motif chemokine 4-like n=1 Tax=Girardinichthys multiradiatus TaxID=208333 RepID=UPI001FAD04AA|nr:C-C motif chemokine 4-like [Girardinichthys multiradiatus]